jgi:hypothetical protein
VCVQPTPCLPLCVPTTIQGPTGCPSGSSCSSGGWLSPAAPLQWVALACLTEIGIPIMAALGHPVAIFHLGGVRAACTGPGRSPAFPPTHRHRLSATFQGLLAHICEGAGGDPCTMFDYVFIDEVRRAWTAGLTKGRLAASTAHCESWPGLCLTLQAPRVSCCRAQRRPCAPILSHTARRQARPSRLRRSCPSRCPG